MTALMLPQIIIDDLFDPNHNICDVILEHLCDSISELSLVIDDIVYHSNDYIIIKFYNDTTEFEITVDRISQNFSIAAVCSGVTIFPATGDWELMMQYIRAV